MSAGTFASLLADFCDPPEVDPFDTFAKIGYTPTARQIMFHEATEYDVLYGGSAGGGKTAALVADDIKDAVRYPGVRIGAYRRTYDELAESLLKQLAAFGYAAALGARWNASQRELTFPNGSVIRYRYVQNIVDASRRQGGEYQKMTFDERSLFAPSVVDHLKERLRTANPAVPVIGVRSGTNPGGADHAAVKERFIDATDHGSKVYVDDHEHTVRFIPAKVTDNPHIDKAYLRTLDAIPDPARRAAMRDGDWDQFSGQFFTEWRHAKHVIPAFPIPEEWRRFAGVDWGYKNPWAVLWAAVDEDDRVYVYRERYATQVGEADQARRILDAEAGERIVARYADDAMWTGRGDAKSVATVYAENGCSITPAKKGERVVGWQRVHSFLADAPACPTHRAAGWETCPKLHVLDGAAPNLTRTLPAMPHDANRVEDIDTKAEDHAPDALRYLLINLHAGPTFVFDDTDTAEPGVQVHATYAIRQDHDSVDFSEGRDPLAGQTTRSPFA